MMLLWYEALVWWGSVHFAGIICSSDNCGNSMPGSDSLQLQEKGEIQKKGKTIRITNHVSCFKLLKKGEICYITFYGIVMLSQF